MRKGECEKMEEAGECKRIELETRKGKEESLRSEEKMECVRSREMIAKKTDRERSCTEFEEEWNWRERNIMRESENDGIVELGREGEGTCMRRGKEKIRERARGRECGATRPSSPPRHDITAPEEPFRAHGLIFFLYYELFDPHVFKRVLAYFPLPFRLPGRFFPFRDPIREALLLCEPSYFYEHV